MQPKIIYGPKGICDDIFLDLFNKPGTAKIKAAKDEKNKINGIDIHPNQKPIADKSLASPRPMPSLFRIFLYANIINHIIE